MLNKWTVEVLAYFAEMKITAQWVFVALCMCLVHGIISSLCSVLPVLLCWFLFNLLVCSLPC